MRSRCALILAHCEHDGDGDGDADVGSGAGAGADDGGCFGLLAGPPGIQKGETRQRCFIITKRYPKRYPI